MPNGSKVVHQVSVFLENKPGRLADVCTLLGNHGINIRALSLADTADFGILRLIVNDPQTAMELLMAHGYSVKAPAVVAAQVPDTPGGLGAALRIIEGAGIGVEYMYAFVGTHASDAVVVFRVPDEAISRTVEVLGENGIPILSAEQVCAL